MALSCVAHDNLCLNNIYRNGDDDQRRKYLPDLCAGKTIGALGLTEPGAGSDALGSMRTTARRDGDHYVLNGTKIYITNGPVADVLLVYAKTDRERGAHGISAFIVEKDYPGFRVAQKLEKMGYRGSQTGELVFEDCRVPVENRVGAGERRRRRRDERPRSRARDDRAALPRHRRARAGAIASTMRGRASSSASRSARFRWCSPCWPTCMSRSRPCAPSPTARSPPRREVEIGEGGRGDIHKLTAASVMYAADAVHAVLDKAVQIHGGSGYIWESEINRLYRSIKLLEIGAGTTEVRKMIIAGELLKGLRAMSEAGEFGLGDDDARDARDRLRRRRARRKDGPRLRRRRRHRAGHRLAARAPGRPCRRRRPRRDQARSARRRR